MRRFALQEKDLRLPAGRLHAEEARGEDPRVVDDDDGAGGDLVGELLDGAVAEGGGEADAEEAPTIPFFRRFCGNELVGKRVVEEVDPHKRRAAY